MQNPLAEKKRGLPTKLGAQLTGTTDKAAGGGVGKRCTRSEDCDLSERERERGESDSLSEGCMYLLEMKRVRVRMQM